MKPETIVDILRGAITVLQALVGVGFSAVVYYWWFAEYSREARLFAAFSTLGAFWLGTIVARRKRLK